MFGGYHRIHSKRYMYIFTFPLSICGSLVFFLIELWCSHLGKSYVSKFEQLILAII